MANNFPLSKQIACQWPRSTLWSLTSLWLKMRSRSDPSDRCCPLSHTGAVRWRTSKADTSRKKSPRPTWLSLWILPRLRLVFHWSNPVSLALYTIHDHTIPYPVLPSPRSPLYRHYSWSYYTIPSPSFPTLSSLQTLFMIILYHTQSSICCQSCLDCWVVTIPCHIEHCLLSTSRAGLISA